MIPLIAGGVLVALLVVAYRQRAQLDMIAAHGSELVRHALALLLMAGTLAGTLFTFSNGTITLAPALETLISVGSIAAALELGAIYTGLRIQKVDLVLLTAKKADRAHLQKHRTHLYLWFYGVVACSVIANLFFRVDQLHNTVLAFFVSCVPAILITLFTIVLRPLPVDHERMAQESAGRAMVVLTRGAGRHLERTFARMGRGHVLSEAERAQLGASTRIVGAAASRQQAQALAGVAQQHAPQLLEAPAIVWWTRQDIEDHYGVSRRAAQGWIANCVEHRAIVGGTGYEAPREAIIRAHGEPMPALRLTPEPRRRAPSVPAQESAPDVQDRAADAPSVALAANWSAPGAQEGATPAQL